MLAMRSCVHGPGVDSGELIADGQWENVDTGRKISSHCGLKICCVFSYLRVVILQNVVMFLKWSQLGVIVISLLNDCTVMTEFFKNNCLTMNYEYICLTKQKFDMTMQCNVLYDYATCHLFDNKIWLYDSDTLWCYSGYFIVWQYDFVTTDYCAVWWDDCVNM